jgi:ribose transport system permease protein
MTRRDAVTSSKPRDAGSSMPDKPHSSRDGGAPKSGWRDLLSRSWIYGALVVLYLFFGVISPRHVFFSTSMMRNIFVDASALLILATGATLVIIAGEIDLSVGSVLVLAAAVAGETMIHLAPLGSSGGTNAMAIGVGILAALVVGTVVGAVNGILVIYAKIPSFLVTLGTLSAGLGLAEVITHGVDITGVPRALQMRFGVAKAFGVPLIIPVSLVICAIFGVLLSKTRFGRHTYAIGSNSEAARRSGIRVGRHLIWIFALAGLLAGATGVVGLARFGTTDVSGHATDALLAISAVAIGGASIYGGSGWMGGTVAGVFIPVIIADGLVVRGVQPFWQNVAVGVLILLAVGIDIRRRGGAEH